MAEILVLTPQLPYPPQQGTSLRNYHMLRALALNHRVTLLSFAEPDRTQELEPLRAIARVLPPIAIPPRTNSDRLKQLVSSNEPDVALRLADGNFSDALVHALNSRVYDAVQIEGIELARCIPAIRRSSPGSRIILDCHNAETELQRRALRTDLARPSRWPAALYSAVQVGRLSRFERWAIQSADAVIAVSETDRAILRDALVALPDKGGDKDGGIFVIPNTIDVAEYEWPGEVPPDLRFDLVFTGKMDYRPNVDGILWFAENVWPLVQRSRSATTWAIVGQRPHPRLASLAELEGVTLTGHIPRVQPYLAGAKVYVVPLRIGSGTRLKLIEAMAAGKPIISTTIGAEGFAVEDEKNILIADDPAAWADSILALLGDPALRESLGAAARAFADQYDWRRIVGLLDSLYASLARQGSAGSSAPRSNTPRHSA